MVPETTNRRDSVFAPGEIGRIIIAWVVLSLAISLSYVGGLPQTTSDYLDIVAAFIATATGFILHEMGHKFTALRLGYTAQFRNLARRDRSNSDNSSTHPWAVYLRCSRCRIHRSGGRAGCPWIFDDQIAQRRP